MGEGARGLVCGGDGTQEIGLRRVAGRRAGRGQGQAGEGRSLASREGKRVPAKEEKAGGDREGLRHPVGAHLGHVGFPGGRRSLVELEGDAARGQHRQWRGGKERHLRGAGVDERSTSLEEMVHLGG